MPIFDDQNNQDFVEFYGNRDNLEVIPVPGLISRDPGKTSDLGGRRLGAPQENKFYLLKERAKENILGTNLPTIENDSQAPNTSLNVPGDIARVEYKRSLALTCYAAVDSYDLFIPDPSDPAGISPLATAAAGGGANPIRGAAVAVCRMLYGHMGTILEMVFDVPPGEIAKASIMASSVRLQVRLMPKYYFEVDAAKRTYFLDFARTIALTSRNFNEINPNIMSIFGFTNANRFLSRGFIAEGSLSSNNELTLPKRRFYGSVAPGAAGLLLTNCPVSWNATAVQLTGGLYVPGGVNSTLQFVMNTKSGQTIGPFNSNQTIPMVQGLESIDVFTNVVTANEVPFELVYFLG